MNIRQCFSWSKPYYLVNREERNLCAILYHLLLINNNLDRFLDWLGCDKIPEGAVPAIYFEYSQLRDIWHGFKDSEVKRAYILDTLDYPSKHWLRSCSFHDFNSYFGAVKEASERYIQSPGRWAISRYDKIILNNDDFLKVSRFKWCFNAKPDIVIHLGDDRAVCIECKFESGEGLYPGADADRGIFAKRSLPLVQQTDIQAYLFQLLGVDCQFYYLVVNTAKVTSKHRAIMWHDVFQSLNSTGAPDYISEWIGRFSPNQLLQDDRPTVL